MLADHLQNFCRFAAIGVDSRVRWIAGRDRHGIFAAGKKLGNGVIYRFEDIEIDTDRFELRQGGVARKVEPQVFALIEFLVSNHGRLVTKDELNLRIWGGRVVSDAVVNSRIRSARLAIGDDGKAQRLIQTVHSRGFRFIGEPVTEDTLAAPGSGRSEQPAAGPDGGGSRRPIGRHAVDCRAALSSVQRRPTL